MDFSDLASTKYTTVIVHKIARRDINSSCQVEQCYGHDSSNGSTFTYLPHLRGVWFVASPWRISSPGYKA
jgi:hypothetical protein